VSLESSGLKNYETDERNNIYRLYIDKLIDKIPEFSEVSSDENHENISDSSEELQNSSSSVYCNQ
jgi:hypothetical protein